MRARSARRFKQARLELKATTEPRTLRDLRQDELALHFARVASEGSPRVLPDSDRFHYNGPNMRATYIAFRKRSQRCQSPGERTAS